MECKMLADIPSEIILEDIAEFTHAFPLEFPTLFMKIQDFIKVDKSYIYIIDFFDDENNDNNFYGYFFDGLNRKLYQYAFESEKSDFRQVDIHTLSVQDSYIIKVLPLLK